MSFRVRIAILILIALGATAFFDLGLRPISQDPAYHDFSDKRAFLGVSNFLNVLSNLPFLIAGALGLWKLRTNIGDRNRFVTPRWEAVPFATAFVGIFFSGLGSVYYHLAPDNATLFWDRLPMTVAFMGFFSLLIGERIHLKTGLFLLPFLLIVGALSVVYWDITEAAGHGNLKPYALVQFLPMLLIPFMLWMFPSPYTDAGYLWQMLGCYAGAKALEHFDWEIFSILGGTVSGHTLKHLLAAWAGVVLMQYLSRRKIIVPVE